MTSDRTHSLIRAARSVCETLEGRVLLCDPHMLANLPEPPQWSEAREADARSQLQGGPEATVIDWTNRGLASDNFATTFGTSAEMMRNIVDAALFSWQRVITNWNRSDGSVSLQVSISVQAPGTNFGGSASPAGVAPADGKPRTGSVSLGGGFNTPDPNDVNGWFADPDPYDNAEFLGPIINAYTSEAAGGGLDFFSLVTIELAHVLGIISDGNNDGGSFDGYRLENFVSNTGVPDTAQGGGNGTYRVFNGSTIDHVMTSYNSGTPGLGSWGNVVHTAGPTANVTFGGLNYRGSVDPGNALYGPQRYLPSFAAAHILADAYGYSIAEPMTFGTFHAVIDDTTGRLTVRGGGGVSDDNINISFINGNTIRVSVDVGADVPGTGALPGIGNLPAFVTNFPAISVSEIVVDGGEGNDTINIESLPFFAEATIRGGLGNDFIQFSRDADNLDAIAAPVNVDAGSGSDTVSFFDYNSTNSSAYAVSSNALTRPGAGGWTLSNTEFRELYGATGNNTFNIASSATGTEWLLAGGIGGNDTFNVGVVGGNADLIDGALNLFGESGTDTLNYNDQSNALPTSYTISNTQVFRTGAGATTYGTIESFTLNGGSGADNVTMATATGSLPMNVFTNAGNDTLTLDSVNYDPAVNHNPMVFLGGNDNDTMNVTPTVGASMYLTHAEVDANGPIWNYGGFENVNVLGTPGAQTYWIQSTASGVNYSLSGGGGNDDFVLGHFFGRTLDGIDGAVTINGDAGSDTVLFDDQQESVARNYSFSSNLVTSGGGTMAAVSYATTEAVRYLGGRGDDNATVLSTLAATPLSLGGFTGSDTVDVLDNAPGSPVLIDGQSNFFGFERVNVNTDGTGAASVRFDFSAFLSELNIFNGGTATLAAGGSKVIDTDALTIAGTGKLDLTDNALIVDYAGASPLNSIKSLLGSGYNGGAWNGNGISSSVAATTPGRALGYAESAAIFSTFPAMFAGRAVDATAVLVRYTVAGDANLDGTVNLNDFNRLAASFGQSGRNWSDGDFTFNGLVNLQDFNVLASNFGRSIAAGPDAEPGEPPVEEIAGLRRRLRELA